MKLSKDLLKQIIKEEIAALKEDAFDDMDDAFGKEKKAPKAKCPANPKEAKSTAIAALKATKGVKDQFKVMDILLGFCVSKTKRGKKKGQPATQVLFRNKALAIVLDSELQ